MQAEEQQRDTRGTRMIERMRARKERHKERSRLYRIAVGTIGVALVLVGFVLALPGVPGPGLLVVAIGLAFLALEFDWAERLLERIVHRLEQVGDATARAGTLQKALTGLVVLVAAATAIAAVVLLDVPFLPL